MERIFELLDASLPLRHYGDQIFLHRAHEQPVSLKQDFERFIGERLRTFGCKADDSLHAEDYHSCIERNGADHYAFIKHCGRVLPEQFAAHPYVEGPIERAGGAGGNTSRHARFSFEFRLELVP
jgi:hypothetical protein